jgi:hypothetical protein
VNNARRGIALIIVLMATALLIVLVGVLVDLGTSELARSAAEVRSIQSLAAADAGAQWARAALATEGGNVPNAVARLARFDGRRLTIDAQTYALVSVSMTQAQPQGPGGDHFDENLEGNPRALETPVQVESSAIVYSAGVAAGNRSITTLLRVFPAPPYSEIVGVIDDGGPVGIMSPGDAGGQIGGQHATELLVNAYTLDAQLHRHDASRFESENWSDGNAPPTGPLP